MVTVTGSRLAGQKAACSGYSVPAGFPFLQGAAAETSILPAGDHPSSLFRAFSKVNLASEAAPLPYIEAMVAENRLGRQCHPRGASSNDHDDVGAPSSRVGAFALQHGQTTRLRITFAR